MQQTRQIKLFLIGVLIFGGVNLFANNTFGGNSTLREIIVEDDFQYESITHQNPPKGALGYEAMPVEIGTYLTTPNATVDIEFRKDIAYIATDYGLEIVNVSVPSSPQFISRYWNGSSYTSIELSGDRIFLTKSGGIEIVDISNPMNPIFLSEYVNPSFNECHQLIITADIAYVLYRDTGFEDIAIMNVSDINNPYIISNYTGLTNSTGEIYLDGHHLYVLYTSAPYGNGLEIIDVHDPNNPTFVSYYNVGENFASINIIDNVAFLGYSGGLFTVDLQDRSNPQLLGSYAEDAITCLDIYGTNIFVNSYDSVKVLEMIDYQTFIELGSYNNSLGSGHKLKYHHGLVYLLHGSDGLTIIDPQISNKHITNPFVLSSHDIDGYDRFARDAKILGNYMYLADMNDGLSVIDIANLQHPFKDGQYLRSSEGYDIEVQGNIAILGDSSSFTIYNISNPIDPIEIHSEDTGMSVFDLSIEGNYLYIAASHNGAEIWDISDLHNPQLVDRYGWADCTGVTVSGQLAYTISNGLGMRILNISNPMDIIEVSSFGTYHINEIVIENDLAYLGTNSDGLLIVDVSDPVNPVLLSQYNEGDVYDLIVYGESVILNLRSMNKIMLLNVTDPSNPFEISEIVELNGQLMFSNNLLYVLNGNNGMELVVIDPGFDFDSDGLPNQAESKIYLTDMFTADSDMDQISDGDEVLVYGTDPTKIDSDVDGIFDFDEIQMYQTAPTLRDTDGDSWEDGKELDMGTNPDNPDNPYMDTAKWANNLLQRGSFYASDWNNVNGLTVNGNFIYLVEDQVNHRGLRIIDASGMHFMSESASEGNGFSIASTSGDGLYSPVEITYSDEKVFIADTTTGLVVYNVSDPYNPYKIGQYGNDGHGVKDVLVKGTYAYILENEVGLKILDLSNLGAITCIGEYFISESHGFEIRENVCYVAEGPNPNGVGIYDISNPWNIQFITDAHVGAAVWDISIQDNFAYLACINGLNIVDISNPESPSFVKFYAQSNTQTIDVSRGIAFLGTYEHVHTIVDVSDPYNPFHLNDFDTDSGSTAGATDIFVYEDLVYVAEWEGGFRVWGTSWEATPIISEPIYIDNFTGFSIGSNGVSGGSGTVGDPWIIENLNFEGDGSGSAIEIRDVTDSFIIRQCTINGFGNGIYLENVQDSYVENNDISYYAADFGGVFNGCGIHVDGVNMGITENTLIQNYVGLEVTGNNHYIANNYVEGTGTQHDSVAWGGIVLFSCHESTIEYNDVVSYDWALFMDTSTYNMIQYNVFRESYGGGNIMNDCHNNHYVDNLFQNNLEHSILFQDGCHDNQLYGNDCTSMYNAIGIQFLQSCYNNEAWNNIFPCDDNGNLQYEDSTGNNNFHDNWCGSPDDSNLIDSEPIYIDNNGGFSIGSNGVSGGSGTVGDPWIIENFKFEGNGTGSAIEIRDVTDSFTIRQCAIDGFGNGIYLENVQNSNVENNVISYCGVDFGFNGCGIHVDGVSIQITENTLIQNYLGLEVTGNDHYIATNFAEGTGTQHDSVAWGGIVLVSCHESTIEYNDVTNYDWALFMDDSTYNMIQHNTFRESYGGGNIMNDCHDNHYAVNLFQNNLEHSILFQDGCYDNQLYGNDCTSMYNAIGIQFLQGCYGNEAWNNLFPCDDNGNLQYEDSTGNNNFHDNLCDNPDDPDDPNPNDPNQNNPSDPFSDFDLSSIPGYSNSLLLLSVTLGLVMLYWKKRKQ